MAEILIVLGVVAVFAIEIVCIEVFEVKRWRHRDPSDIMKGES